MKSAILSATTITFISLISVVPAIAQVHFIESTQNPDRAIVETTLFIRLRQTAHAPSGLVL
ncbi:hypothetical protein V2H45_08510 [Tumidithrix elongata RA019]|uniref:Uncharacterized protein n=1 Tax=Tumidithrix elongata BACA0141 TaxID=2716417 RepID=A0AAW9Q005_9CYAN|nr:hypothetical protein [Tumidithrix elongata RA019]